MTLEQVFKNAVCHSAASTLENPVPGPSSDVQLPPDDDDDDDDDDDGDNDASSSPKSSS